MAIDKKKKEAVKTVVKITDEVDYRNVWLKYDNNGMLYVNFYGVEKKLKIFFFQYTINGYPLLLPIPACLYKVFNYSVKYILSLSFIHFPLTNIKLRR